MKSAKYFLVSLFLGWGLLLPAQHALGFDLELNRDFLKIEDPGAEIGISPRINVSPGLCYRYLFKNDFTLSTGTRMKQYPQSITFKSGMGTFTGSGNVAVQLPLKLGRNFWLSREVNISPLAGATLNLFLFDNPGWGAGSVSTGSDSLRFAETTVNRQRAFVTFHIGFSLELMFTRRISGSFFCQYNHGLAPVSRELVTYRTNQDPPVEAAQVNKGNYATYVGFRLLGHFGKRTGAASPSKKETGEPARE